MEEFSFSTRIFFGEGALERLRRVQDKKVMIVTDRFMAGIGVPDKVAGHLTRCQVSVFDGVVPDPPHRGGGGRRPGPSGLRRGGHDRRGRRLHH